MAVTVVVCATGKLLLVDTYAVAMGAADRSIEGEWQGFEFRIIHDEDFEIVNEHLGNNFFRDEPISQLIGFTPEFVSDVSKIWRPTISQNLSLVATDKVTKKVSKLFSRCLHGQKIYM